MINDIILISISIVQLIFYLPFLVLCEFYSIVGSIVIDFNSIIDYDSIDTVVGGHIALERTLNPSVSCPNGTLYSSEICPQGHTALGYNVRGDILRGGHVTL